jgi:nitroreductase
MKIHELISARKSIRAFIDKSIPGSDLLQLFEAARWAPSSRNEQPWRFIFAQKEDPVSFEKMLSILNESNRMWARNASALILVVAKSHFSDIDKPNSHALYDTGLAVANLSFQATAMDLSVHQLGGFNAAMAGELFHVPQEFRPVVMIALGYRGEAESLPEPLRSREALPRQRKPLEELLFSKVFGEKSNFVVETKGKEK